MKPWILYPTAALGALAMTVGALVALALATEHSPADVEAIPAPCSRVTPPIELGAEFDIISWNLQYGASRKHRFFYDGGDAVHVPEADVTETVSAISAVLQAERPDIALLQEVDRDSTRTGGRDQLPSYIAHANAACAGSAAYHRSPFVPSPPTAPLGRVDMHLALLTLPPLQQLRRISLPLLDEPRYRQVFNLKRALLTGTVPVAGGGPPLALAVTHLSAFSHGDGTLEKQIATLKAWIDAREPGQPWILAGDFNLLPPGFSPRELSVESELYADEANPIDALLPGHRTLFPDQLDPANRTYLPFGATEPDRKIDYVFIGGPIQVASARVMTEHASISDHLPIQATLRIVSPDDPTLTAADDAPEPEAGAATE